jgi:type III restriction enzyme
MSKPKFRHQLSSGNGRTSNVFFELEKPVPLDEGIKSLKESNWIFRNM